MEEQAVWRRGAPVRFPSARWELTFSRALRRENGGRLELALPYSPAEGRPLYFEKTENYVYHFTKDCATITMEFCQNQRK